MSKVDEINKMINELNGDETDGIFDGSHTFGELYYHRAVLFASIISLITKTRLHVQYDEKIELVDCWKSKFHDDGSMFDGYFIVGIKTHIGQATYHYPLEYWDMFDCKEIKNAPPFDGHTPNDAIERLGHLFKVKPFWPGNNSEEIIEDE